MSILTPIQRARARADTLEALGRENRPLNSEHDVAHVVLTREQLRDVANDLEEAYRALRWVYEHGMRVDRPKWVSGAFDKSYREIR